MDKVYPIIEALKEAYPDPRCALEYEKDYELMIAVRLSAQCTDERVNMITPALFARFPTLESFASADVAEVEELVHSCGFYRHKARDIVLACQMLLEKFDGKVPGTMEELLSLPGVGRKTANLLGLAKGKEPEKVEQQLRAILPPEESSDFCHRIVLHGRAVCIARRPQCQKCTLAPWCSSFAGETAN